MMIKNQHFTDASSTEIKIAEKKSWVTPNIEIIAGANIASGNTSDGNEGQHTFLFNTFGGIYHS